MSDPVKASEIDLRAFRIDRIRRDEVDRILTRLVLVNTKPGRASQYMVTAFPANAKAKQSTSGLTISTWPEVVIGFIMESGSNGGEKLWNLHPTLKSGTGWRKKSIWTVTGRDAAARYLLSWTANENEVRIARRG